MEQRKLFGTDGIRGIANCYPMTPELIMKVGKAVSIVLRNNKPREYRPKILIGKDTRISGYIFESSLTAGICSSGGDVLLVGPMPTPAIAHLTKSFAADAGIVISASHNPSEQNGIKVFDSRGFKLPDEKELEIEKLVFSDISNEHIKGALVGKAKRIDDAAGRYIEFAKTSIDNMSLSGLKIVLDCANGAAYHISPDIFSELGAEVIVLNNTPNGLNINYNCGALHPQAISKKVVEERADLGIALDGDADRVIMVDELGEELNGDHIMAICALDLLRKSNLPKNTIVATHYSNLGLDESLSHAGGKVVRVDNGDRYVIEEMTKNGYFFGGEQSGHIIFRQYTTTGDGTISALQVLRILKESNKKLSELKKCLIQYPQKIISLNVREKRDFDSMPSVKKAIEDAKKILSHSGRVIIRYSGTEMKARVMVEGKTEEVVNSCAENIANAIKEEVGV